MHPAAALDSRALEAQLGRVRDEEAGVNAWCGNRSAATPARYWVSLWRIPALVENDMNSDRRSLLLAKNLTGLRTHRGWDR
jgi:hypothetical protein